MNLNFLIKNIFCFSFVHLRAYLSENIQQRISLLVKRKIIFIKNIEKHGIRCIVIQHSFLEMFYCSEKISNESSTTICIIRMKCTFSDLFFFNRAKKRWKLFLKLKDSFNNYQTRQTFKCSGQFFGWEYFTVVTGGHCLLEISK